MIKNEKNIVKKPWGEYEDMEVGDKHLIRLITVQPNQSLSLQTHEGRSEHWFVLDGIAEVIVDTEKKILHKNQSIEIEKKLLHRLTNIAESQLKVLEIQYGDKLEETDIVRYKDLYGRLTYGNKRRSMKMLEGPVVIAEIGCNHRGEIDTALEMIRVAAQFCKVDVVKFQKRNIKELLSEEEFNSPHPNPQHSYGRTYGEHRENLEFDLSQHKILKRECEDWNVIYSASIWDVTSAREIASLGPEFIKVPSSSNTNFKILGYLAENYPGEIHISLGMTTKKEEDQIVDFFVKNGRNKDVVLYACTSGYPIPDSDVCLFEIKRLKEKFGKIVKEIGFSGHHNGIAIDVGALVLGARYIERHFTLDRTWKGTDHAASLEPDGLRRVARDLKSMEQALKFKSQDILEIEKKQREKLKWNRRELVKNEK